MDNQDKLHRAYEVTITFGADGWPELLQAVDSWLFDQRRDAPPEHGAPWIMGSVGANWSGYARVDLDMTHERYVEALKQDQERKLRDYS